MARKKNSTKRSAKNVEDFGTDGEPFVDDISELFNMGFVSIEEVDYFDPKKHQADSVPVTPTPTATISSHEESALQSGWTVSTTKKCKVSANEPNKKNRKMVKMESNSEAVQKPADKPKPKQKKKQPKQPNQTAPVEAPIVADNEFLEWKKFPLNSVLLSALKSATFDTPMPIQVATMDAVLRNGKRDILASAPTGSGKTLAFGLPLLNYIYNHRQSQSQAPTKDPRRLSGLIIVPTRELAVQIEKHLKSVSRYPGADGYPVRIASVIGGLSLEKQTRQLENRPDIIIATPGRLSEVMEFDFAVRAMITGVKFLILDEADRMVQTGHYRELDGIISRILSSAVSSTDTDPRHVFLFSATLEKSRDKKAPFNQLCSRLSLDPKNSTLAILDLAGRPISLEESYALCASQDDKETVLFSFLLELRADNSGRFGRVLVFANSIDTIRRLTRLFGLLQIPTIALHAQMQQRQRLNNLDRFKAMDECLMLASDVAARGIDITGVDHVIHFHLPKSQETYVHRCGRTARANRSGCSLALVAPEERKLAESCSLTTRKDEVSQYIPDTENNRKRIIPALKLARRIEVIEHTERSARSEINWAQKTADDLGIILDEDNDPSYRKRQEQSEIDPKALAKELANAKQQLTRLLSL